MVPPGRPRHHTPHDREDVLGGQLVSDRVVQNGWNVAAGASPKGTLDCVSAWTTADRLNSELVKFLA